MKNEELILKLLKGIKPDIIIGMELLREYTDEEIKRFFEKYDNYNREFSDTKRGYFSAGGIKGIECTEEIRFSMMQGNRAIFCGNKDNYLCTILLDPLLWEGIYNKDVNL